MMTAGWIFASGLVLAAAYFWLRAMFSWLDGVYPDESNRSFPAPSSEGGGERGGGVVPRSPCPERRGTPPLGSPLARYQREVRRAQRDEIRSFLKGLHLR